MGSTATDESKFARPRTVPARLADGRIEHDADESTLADDIQSGQIVIFKDVFTEEVIHPLRKAIVRWGESCPEFEHGKSASLPDINFHRRDDDSTPTTMPHIFHQYGFGKWDDLPDFGDALMEVSGILMDIQNRLAGTGFSLPSSDWRIKAMRHPRGGGYLVPHRHPYLPQRVGVFLNISEPGIDYDSGAARFKNSTGWLDTREEFRLGDVLAWRYDLVHGVDPIDPDKTLKWDGDDGLWIYALEAVEAHPKSKGVAP